MREEGLAIVPLEGGLLAVYREHAFHTLEGPHDALLRANLGARQMLRVAASHAERSAHKPIYVHQVIYACVYMWIYIPAHAFVCIPTHVRVYVHVHAVYRYTRLHSLA